jgi:LacI family transcriptional regulator
MTNIQEVARAAGVSTATVSRFLSGQPVRSGEAIQRAVQTLGYSPSVVARSLKSGRHGSIGVIVPDITNPFFSALVKGINQEARAAGYQVILGNSDEDAPQEEALLAALTPRTDGIIIAPLVEGDLSLVGLEESLTPVVLVDRDITFATRFDRVLVDNLSGARQAVEHLAALGHRAIAHIGGPLGSTPGRARHEGFVASMEEMGLPVRQDLIRTSDFREEGGRESMIHLWNQPNRPTAVFVANNLMTIGALNALHDLGVRVPDDISIVGFDDLALAGLLNPPLTVIRRPDIEQGAASARLLLARLEQDLDSAESLARSHRITLPVQLVVRGSTAAPVQTESEQE